MTASPLLPHTQYLDLLDRHGRAALDALGGLSPRTKVPPHTGDALVYAREHLATLEIWAWLLAHPEADWRGYEAVVPPSGYADVLERIGRERDGLTRLLVDVGPDLALDYFDRPGTSHEVARLLAHDTISIASAAGEASGTPVPPLHPDVASDCIDRALAHWSEPDADVTWSPSPAHLVAADTGQSWWIRFSHDPDEIDAAIAPASPGPPAIAVSDSSGSLLRWLEGYAGTSPQVDGDPATLRMLRVALGHRVEQAPRRPWWRRG